MSSVPPDRALTVLLAEYASIRTSIDRKATAELTLISLNVTTVAAVVGLTLSYRLEWRLLLVLPIFSSLVGLMLFSHHRSNRYSVSYVRDVLQPLTAEYVGDDRLLRWSGQYGTVWKEHQVVVALAVPMGLLFPGVSAVCLSVTAPQLESMGDWATWVLGATVFGVMVATWVTTLRQVLSGQAVNPSAAGRRGGGSGEAANPLKRHP